MIQPPTLDDLRSLSDVFHLNASEEELKVYSGFVAHDLETLQLLEEWQMPSPIESKGYKERKFHRCKPEENPYNAWYYKCHITRDDAPSKLLSNYKIAIKDNTSIAMVPMMVGSKLLEGFVPEDDATIVERILSHGGAIVGTATCENLSLSGVSYNTTYGPVRNPWNPKYSAGGSSSGSAVVIAVGEADMAVGCDQGGSIRIPASSCGIVGLKPTFGLVPYTGIVPIETTLDHVGPMTRNVADCARLLQAIAGFDEGKDFRQPSCGFSLPSFVDEVPSAKSGTLRIGILKEGFHECDKEIIERVNQAVALIKSSGKFLDVDEVSIPNHNRAMIPYMPLAFIGIKNQLIDGLGFGTGIAGALDHKLSSKLYEGMRSQAHTLHHTVKEFILSTSYVKKTNAEAFYKNYAKAQTIACSLKKEYDQVMARYDALLMPTLPKLPSKIPVGDESITEAIENTGNMFRNTAPFDITHHPAITLNCGYDEQTGLPIGLQLVGRLWDDATLLKLAKLVEDVLAPLQRTVPSLTATQC